MTDEEHEFILIFFHLKCIMRISRRRGEMQETGNRERLHASHLTGQRCINMLSLTVRRLGVSTNSHLESIWKRAQTLFEQRLCGAFGL